MSNTSSNTKACYPGSLRSIVISTVVVLGVAISWTASAQFSQRALTVSPQDFNAPYFSMWFGTNFMILCFPVYLIYEIIKQWSFGNVGKIYREAGEVFGKEGLTIINVLKYVTPFLIFWIFANYAFSRALMVVAASVATAISSCNAVMVYILSILLLRESLLVTKSASVVFAMAGVIIMSINLPESSENKIPWLGVLLSVVSAFSAAVYKVAFKKIIKKANLGQVSLFMTCLGLLNLMLNWGVPAILYVTGIEHINWGKIPWGYMCGSAVLNLVFNFLLNFGVVLLSPLVPSIGMLVGIPINTVCDVVFSNLKINTLFVIGTALIGCSFLLIILPLDGWKLNQLYIRKEKNMRATTYQSC